MNISFEYLANGKLRRAIIIIAINIAYVLSFSMFTTALGQFLIVKIKIKDIMTINISKMVTDLVSISMVIIYHLYDVTSFLLPYLDLTLIHFKVQDQIQAH